MGEFKKGERVAVYGHKGAFTHRVVGTVAPIPPDADEKFHDGVYVFVEDLQPKVADGLYAHPKQCRRLVKRARRRVWVFVNSEGRIALQPSCVNGERPLDNPSNWIEFREVLRRKTEKKA